MSVLAGARRRTPLTQAQVAAAMGVSRTRVSEIEHTALRDLDPAIVTSYLAALGARRVESVVIMPLGGYQLVLGRQP